MMLRPTVNYGFEVIPGASLCRKVDPGTAFWSRACDVHVRIRPKKIPPCLRHWTDSNKIRGKEKHWNIAGTLGLYCLRQGLTIMNNYRDLKRSIVYYVPEVGRGGGLGRRGVRFSRRLHFGGQFWKCKECERGRNMIKTLDWSSM